MRQAEKKTKSSDPPISSKRVLVDKLEPSFTEVLRKSRSQDPRRRLATAVRRYLKTHPAVTTHHLIKAMREVGGFKASDSRPSSNPFLAGLDVNYCSFKDAMLKTMKSRYLDKDVVLEWDHDIRGERQRRKFAAGLVFYADEKKLEDFVRGITTSAVMVKCIVKLPENFLNK